MSRVPFHPLVERWFESTFAGPTAPQETGWQAIASGRDTLIAAPTGSGKTLAAFLWSLNRIVERAAAASLEDGVSVIYVSPLKALGNDIEKNLRVPLGGIRELAEREGLDLGAIRVAVRSGDTPVAERQLHLRHPPHVLITTPESLYILLTAEKSRRLLASAETVIVDEIHALAADKRGAHLALSLERLDRLCGRRLQRIGLSATQKPIEEIARLLVGTGRISENGTPDCAIVDAGHIRTIDLSIETPDIELGPIASHEMRAEIYDRIVELSQAHRTTIVFTNTRRLVERVAHELTERLGEGKVAAHHGSLSRTVRLAAEEGLKSGTVSVVVATASLELGIDVGHVDLVCHLGVPRAIATLLQRVGRSGHWLGAVPKGILFPLTRDELVQAAALVRAVRAGDLDRVAVFETPLDILAQQIVATTASDEISVEEMLALVRGAYPFRALERKDFDQVLEMLAEGVASRKGRRSAHLHYDRVNGMLRARRGARLAAITGGGAIPDTADYDVVDDVTAGFIGKVNEDFAVESLAGDVFLLGNKTWRIKRVEAGRIRVHDAEGATPTIPFWMGEAPGRTLELSAAVADLRRNVAELRRDPAAAIELLVRETGVDRAGAEQIFVYVADTMAVLGAMPTLDTIVAERFFDEAGGMQLIVHSPYGSGINRALGLALRKRFCVSFDFELQAAATDDGVVISLGEQHSFPLDSVFSMVRPRSYLEDLTQAALVSPMFTNRWRWNATRSLALLRFSGGKKVPVALQRMRAEDLLAAVFPAQVACGDNHPGPIELVDHPLVKETISNCLYEAMDAKGLKLVLDRLERGEIRTVAVETLAPSPMSHEILNANPYAYLDDAPLEERRARAVSLRRVDPDLASGLGALDAAAITEVRRQAAPEPRDADEVHDFMLSVGILPTAVATAWAAWLQELVATGRATLVEATHWVATERTGVARALFPSARFVPDVDFAVDPVDADAAALSVVRGWMDVVGPTTAAALGDRLGLPTTLVEIELARIESEGGVLRGRFTPGSTEEEWCERGLLARIHRLTLGRLRREIEPVSIADLHRFLFRWQHLDRETRLHGREGIREIVRQLGGIEIPGPAWERDVLPARIADYRLDDLEHLCLAGEVAWGRLGLTLETEEEDEEPVRARRRAAPTRSAPLAFCLRDELGALLEPMPADDSWRSQLSLHAGEVLDFLERRGASFLADIARGISRLPTETEDALWELVAAGLVTGDGIAGLRTLLLPEDKRRPKPKPARRSLSLVSSKPRSRLMPVGRWSLLRPPSPLPVGERSAAKRPGEGETIAESTARRLLSRYGIVLRELTLRERRLPPWREILFALRRLEARGEVRGGRFVDGFVGEQFALPEAVEAMRAIRRRKPAGEIVLVSAADPLNLVGALTPGARVSAQSGQVIAYKDGLPVDVGELGAVLSRLRASGSPP